MIKQEYVNTEKQLINCLKEGTYLNKTYLDLVHHSYLNFLYKTEAMSNYKGCYINLIDAFADSFDNNPYKGIIGKCIKLSVKAHDIFWGERNRKNYINENTMLEIIRCFLIIHNVNCIKKVPILVWAANIEWATDIENLNFFKKIMNIPYGCFTINDCLKINMSIERLNKKREYLHQKFISAKNVDEKIDLSNKAEVLNFIEKYNLVTPLILACKLKNIKLATFLIHKGANWKCRDMHQKSAYDYALQNGLLANGRHSTELLDAWHDLFIYRKGNHGLYSRQRHQLFWKKLSISKKLKWLNMCIRKDERPFPKWYEEKLEKIVEEWLKGDKNE